MSGERFPRRRTGSAKRSDPPPPIDPKWRDALVFHEYLHGDSGIGLGTGDQPAGQRWVAKLLERVGRGRQTANDH
jgi:hypothetical protein